MDGKMMTLAAFIVVIGTAIGVGFITRAAMNSAAASVKRQIERELNIGD